MSNLCRGTERPDWTTKSGKVKFVPCPLWEGAKSVCCAGRGSSGKTPPPAPIDILFVGEAPGPEEDAANQAFVGDAGKLFECVLEEKLPPGLTWWVTNAARCYPGKAPTGSFKKPPAVALSACLTYLERDIEQLRPKLIVPMGSIAVQQVLAVTAAEAQVSRRAGRLWTSRFRRPGFGLTAPIPAFVLRHPAWARRDLVNNLALWVREWEALARYLSTGEVGQPLPGKWQYLRDQASISSFYGDLLARLSKKGGRTTSESRSRPLDESRALLAVDYETTGLVWWQDEITMIGYGLGPEEAVVVDVRAAPESVLWGHRSVLAFCDAIFHNFPFDGTFGLGKWGLLPGGTVWDTKVLAYLVDENAEMSLESQVDRHLPALSGFKDESEDVGWGKAEMPAEVLARRCAYDCMATWQLREKLWDLLTPRAKELYSGILARMLKTLVKMKVRGWKLDLDMLNKLRETSRRRAAEIRNQIENDPHLAALNGGKPLNPNSPVAVAEVLGKLGIKDGPKMASREDLISTSKDVLARHLDRHWLVGALLEYGRHINHVERADHYLKYAHAGHLYPGYNYGGQARQDSAAATVTGRLSSAKPNVMNPPKLYRRCFVSRFPGGRILSADYSQLELRIVAAVSGEEGLIEAFRTGADPHGLVARQISELLGVPVDRHIGKRLNFASVYGSSATTIYENMQRDALLTSGKPLPLTLEQVRQMHRAWWETHPSCERYMRDLHLQACAEGVVRGLFGQDRRVPAAMSADQGERQRALRQLGNFPIQNAGAIITLWAMTNLDQALFEKGCESIVIGQMHDSVIVDVAPGEEETVKALVYRIMRDDMNAALRESVPGLILDIDVTLGYDLRGPVFKPKPAKEDAHES